MNIHRPRVIAVVVAYDRRDLLKECLDALACQSRKVDQIIVIDNASPDDSAVIAADHPAKVDVVILSRNTGGAGGFAAGIAHALQTHQADFVWLMDDDTIPTPRALEELLVTCSQYPEPIPILGSRVVWHNGQDHPMNTPRVRPGASGTLIAQARAVGAIPVRSSSFVSMLVDAKAIRYWGLPMADYFIWNDDFEFSCRLLRKHPGLYVPSSVVEHRTKKFGGTNADPGERFYFEVRNKIWMFIWSRALSPEEKLLYGGATLRRWVRTFRQSADPKTLTKSGLRGFCRGLFSKPQATEITLARLGHISKEVEEVEKSRRNRK